MRPITVTQPFLPPLEEFEPYLRQIWSSRVLTNCGPLHQELERELARYLGIEHLSLFANATIAMIVALQVLDLTGDVITSPFSFVAGAHALRWQQLRPVFVDIDPDTLNLDPSRIEAAITPATRAILPVHCYGNPCAIDAIQAIADRHGLRVIYDAAHAFGIRLRGESVLTAGDLSVLSFHATKVFSTFEGGAIVCHDEATKARIDRLRNFGFVDEVTVREVGLNAKMSEVHAAFGLLQLRHIDEAIARRAEIAARYRRGLANVPGIRCVGHGAQDRPNHTYFPVRVETGYSRTRDGLFEHLKTQGVYARRYFHPLISDFPAYREESRAITMPLPEATQAAQEILCLPIYPAMLDADVDRVLSLVAT
jgi:dTDP-4-amino-4,6-dideoxygalactose transaminase